MQKTSLPEWLVARASVERARFGHITRRTAGLINERKRPRPERTRSERPQHPITQNVGQLIEARLAA